MFSRTGLAGGAQGAVDVRGRPRTSDWTVWAAFGFSVLPDALSIGIGMLAGWLQGEPFTFARVPAYVLVLYKFTHALGLALACSILIRCLWKPLFLPSLAWPAHILMDMLTHGHGRWQSFPLFPAFHFYGISWWEHPWVIAAYWGLLPLLWLAIHLWRRHAARVT